MKKRVFAAFLIFFVFWLLLTWSISAETLITGAILSSLIAFFCRNFSFDIPLNIFHPRRVFWIIVYLGFVVWEVLRSNVMILFAIIRPSIKLNVDVFDYKKTFKGDRGLAVFSGTLTLILNTAIIEVDEENGILQVECADISSFGGKKAIIEKIGKFDLILAKIVN